MCNWPAYMRAALMAVEPSSVRAEPLSVVPMAVLRLGGAITAASGTAPGGATGMAVGGPMASARAGAQVPSVTFGSAEATGDTLAYQRRPPGSAGVAAEV
jgi:hypothetical protein